jgi:hypothetical protein
VVRWVVLICFGCNQIYGLDKTEPRDASTSDAETFACPPAGVDLRFKRQLHQIPINHCSQYIASLRANRSIAFCDEPVPGYYAGPVDGPLEIARGLAAGPGEYLEYVHLSADGDFAVGRLCDAAFLRCSLATYVRNGDDSWSRAADLPIPAQYSTHVGRPTYGPDPHIFVDDQDAPAYQEWARRSGVWELVGSYQLADWGLDFMELNGLSPDGLRMLFHGRKILGPLGMYYLDRPSLDARFETAARELDMPFAPQASQTDDCARLYFSGLDRILYLEQEQ